jgi:glycosyltransferase involved in cell wall biosynthesis
MAQSKAVLASGVGGIRELVEHEKTGLLFKAEDINDFCAQATRLVQQSDLRRRLGEQGRETILRERDWKVLARRYQDVYDYALAAHKRR